VPGKDDLAPVRVLDFKISLGEGFVPKRPIRVMLLDKKLASTRIRVQDTAGWSGRVAFVEPFEQRLSHFAAGVLLAASTV
jgi:hypothetical protein